MRQKGQLQVRLEYAAIRSVFFAIRALPKAVALRLAAWLARTVFLILGGRMSSGIRNLELAFPEMEPNERKRILRASVENIGRTIVEFVNYRAADAEESRKTIRFDFESEDFQVYKKAKAEGRGVLMPTAHIGNWEILLGSFSLEQHPIFFLAREIDNPLIDKMFVDMRARFGSRQIYKSESAKSVLKALRAGESVGVLPDVNTDRREGVFVPFFGVPACTTAGVARLAIRTNALIFPMYAVWDEAKNRYVVYNGQPIEPFNSGDHERDVTDTTAAFTAEIENIVRRFPEQWLWIHRRWKTRPLGEPSLY